MWQQADMGHPTFYILHPDESENSVARVDLIREVCVERGVTCVALNSSTQDYTELPKLQRGDILFNSGRGSTRMETMLSVPGIATFRTKQSGWIDNNADTTVYTAAHDRLKLPGPATVHDLPQDGRLLLKYVEYLGGPPIVLKAAGGTRGEGIIFCPDLPSILSTVDFLKTQERQFIMREFVPHTEVLRVTVLAKRSLCTIAHPHRANDFRSSIDGTYEHRPNPNPEVERLAVRAMEACEYEFGGVDIIDHPERGPLLIEANAPCNFTSIKRKIGVDIAGPMVEHLLAKSVAIRASSSGAPK